MPLSLAANRARRSPSQTGPTTATNAMGHSTTFVTSGLADASLVHAVTHAANARLTYACPATMSPPAATAASAIHLTNLINAFKMFLL